ncbi:MAG: DUF3828 domain-containing protein [Anaerolineae bacterium]|nr:DUF3828 domain-containing protein [Anaerolineae bacterium]
MMNKNTNILLLTILSLAACRSTSTFPETDAAASTSSDTAISITANGQQSPIDTLAAFYGAYTNYPGNPLVTRAYKDNSTLRQYMTDDLVTGIDEILASFDPQGGGYDPFVCAQDRPPEFSFETLETSGSQATIRAYAGFPGTPATRIDVEMIRENDRWLIDTITCLGSESSVPQSPPPTDLPSEPGSEWLRYRNQDYDFGVDYPGGWIVYETTVDDPRDIDPVEGYVTFSDQDGPLPVALVISTGAISEYRLVFPKSASAQTLQTAAGYQVLSEEQFRGEQYYIILHPTDDALRVALRVISREGPVDTRLETIINMMLDSFVYRNS